MTTLTPQPALLPLDSPRAQRRRHELRLITLAWVFGAAWMYIANGSVMQEFLRTLGTPEWAFGLIGTLPMVCGLMQLPGSILVETYAIRKRLFLWTATASRAMFIVAGLVPWLLPGAREGAWWTLVAILVAVSWSLAHASGPAWWSWMTQVIPRRVRGRYLAFRSQVGQVIGVIVTLSTGFLLDALGGQVGADDHRLRLVTSLLLIVAGVLGVLDIQCFHPVRDTEDAQAKRAARGTLRRRVAAALRSRNLRLFLAFMFVMHLGIGFLGAYVYLFLRVELGLSMTMFNLCVCVIPLLVTIVGLRFWGAMIDKLGSVKVLSVAAILAVDGPLGWLLTTREVFWPGYLLTLISPFAFSGVFLAIGNLTMSLSSVKDTTAEGDAAAGQAGSVNVALISIAAACGAILSGVLGGAVAEAFADFRFDSDRLGITITYHGLLFILSMVIRFVAALLALAMVARHAPRLRDAVKQQVATVRAKRRASA